MLQNIYKSPRNYLSSSRSKYKMSTHIPSEIEAEIIKRLPVKSVVRFRSVSKAWKALIDNPEFIAAYSVRRTQPQHLFIRYKDILGDEKYYVSIVDDDTFPYHSFAPTVPLPIKQLHNSRIVGSSGGLLCLYGYYREGGARTGTAVLWNPSIRKSVAISVPNSYEFVLGFGVCRRTSDPKIVKIKNSGMLHEVKKTTSIPGHVEVFTLSSGTWRSPFGNLPRNSISLTWSQAAIDGFIYLLASDITISAGGGFHMYNLIMLFEMSTEQFREVDLPEQLALQPSMFLSISKLRDSLAVLEYNIVAEKQVCAVWMMKHGDSESFTKLFTIKSSRWSMKTLGFRKSGEPITEKKGDYLDYFGRTALAVYEPCTKRINDFGIYGRDNSFFVSSYMETLLLLN